MPDEMPDAEHVPAETTEEPDAVETTDSEVATGTTEEDATEEDATEEDDLDDLDDMEFMLDEIENRIAPLA